MDKKSGTGSSTLKSNFDLHSFNESISKWEPQSEVWPFAYGDLVSCAPSMITGSYLVYYFRKFLKLQAYGRLASYSPTVGFGCVVAYALQSEIITPAIVERNSCPLCIPIRSGFFQVVSGFVLPALLTPMATFFLAERLLTYPIPPIKHAPRETFNLLLQVFRKYRIVRPLCYGAALQFVTAMYVTYEKRNTLDKIAERKI